MINRRLVSSSLRKIADKLDNSITIDLNDLESFKNLQGYSGKIIGKHGNHEYFQAEVTNFSYAKIIQGHRMFKGNTLKVISGQFCPVDFNSDVDDIGIGLSSFSNISGKFFNCLFSNCMNLNINHCINSKISSCKNISIGTANNVEIVGSNNISISRLFGTSTAMLHLTNCADIECKFELTEHESADVYFFKCYGKLNVPQIFDASFKNCNFQKDSAHFSSFEEFLSTELPKCKNIQIDMNDPNLNGAVFSMQDWKKIRPKYLQAYANVWNSDKENYGFEEDELITPELIGNEKWNDEHSIDGFVPYSEDINPSDKYVAVFEIDFINVISFSTEEELEDKISVDWTIKINWM